MRSRLVFASTVLLVLTGCGTSDPTPAPAPPAGSSPAAAPTAPAAPKPVDAKMVLAKLKAADLGMTGAATQTEDNDPNNLLGRPNGYTQRASADLPGGDKGGEKFTVDRGLVIEVWPTAADADRRAAYIQTALKGAPILGTEYHYRAGGGAVLVRVSGKVKPSLAKKVDAALAGL
ncbi:hypothetical protein ABZ949_01895 [Micromonospora tulbaghiae]|uniref:hypothetical protein n=1 Tax=Micromonospora tulbaghiae TaxID=479978 RepID=UPI0033DD7FBA